MAIYKTRWFDRWARKHHAAWYREVMNKEQRP